MIRAIAIDDEPPALKLLENFCAQANYIALLKTFTKPQEASAWINENPADLLFLDIRMPSMSGIDLFKALEHKPLVIFTTAYSEYAVEGFDLDVVDYLLKPFTYERFLKATSRAKEYYDYIRSDKKPEQHIIIRADYSLNKILLSDILFIESAGDYLKFHLQKGKTIVARMTMKAIMEKLPSDNFVRAHRSYVVALAHITAIHDKNIILGSAIIPIGLNYEEDFFSKYDRSK